MTTSAPGGRPQHRHRRAPRRGFGWWAGRIGSAGVVVALSVAVAMHQLGWRGWEAWVAGQVTALFTASPAYVHRSVFYVGLSEPGGFGLRVTGECTSALVAVGVLGITAVLAVVSTLPLRRLVLATVLSVGIFYLINIARLVMIALATRRWGLIDGFHWAHVWAGTFVTVVGGLAVFALYLLMIGKIGRPTGKARTT